MNNQRIVGILLVIVGVILFVVGMNASDSLADRWSNFFTGHFTDRTVWYMVGGIAASLLGLSMVAFNGKANAT